MQTFVTNLERAATTGRPAAPVLHTLPASLPADGAVSRVAAVRAATHLIRNSLNTIALCADVLLQARTPPDQGPARLELIRRVAHDTTGFLEDLADAVDGAAGRAGERSWISPSELVAAALERARATAEARGVRMIARQHDECPAISGDLARLTRALHAVLAYAIAETADGTVRVSAQPVTGLAGGVRVRVVFGGARVPDRAPSLGDPETSGRSREWLMLAVAHATIVAHGGTMSTERTPATSAIGVWIPTPALRSLP